MEWLEQLPQAILDSERGSNYTFKKSIAKFVFEKSIKNCLLVTPVCLRFCFNVYFSTFCFIF